MSEMQTSPEGGHLVEVAAATGRVRPPDHSDRTDRWLGRLSVAGVSALTGLGWVLSYTALRQLALNAGMTVWAATVWPFVVDTFVFVATLAAIADRRRGRPTSYAWTLAGLYSAGTVAGNVVAAGSDHVAQAVHATPAVTMILAWHLLSRMFSARGGRTDTRETGQTPPSGHHEAARPDGTGRRVTLAEVAAWVTEQEESGHRPTGDTVAARFGVSDRTGRRLLTAVRSRPDSRAA